ncbi:MAG: hypothetical protein Sapg2KO_03790 [Saprospiraceae bacterium]
MVLAQVVPTMPTDDYWTIINEQTIRWDLSQEKRLPHQENIEMSGKKVSAIIYYELDENRNLSINRDVIFPQLRTFNKTSEPDWKKYRAYFRRTADGEVGPKIHIKNQQIIPAQVDSIEIGGQLTFYHTPVQGVQITRTLFPAMEDRFLVEKWTVKNLNESNVEMQIANAHLKQEEFGYKGLYSFVIESDAPRNAVLSAGAEISFPVYYGATLNEESIADFDLESAETNRHKFLETMQDNLVLKTPNPIINTLFYFSKIRASESIFNSSMGLVHSPGGGNYYVGIWANDQVEYSGPFFPYLGYEIGNTAAYNTYKMFQKNIPEGDQHIAYAFEVDGNFPMEHLDRGDAAMIAYGLSHYLLASGDYAQAKELWPLLEWSLSYCHKNRNTAGAVISESDEMEGRIPTGDANLATSSLYYGGLKYSERLAKDLKMPQKAKAYGQRKAAMETVIESYFGATINGVETYKYFQENKYLRHWICLPLSVGITERKMGTLDALFNQLWTDNGILVELKTDTIVENTMFWDRATLYALQGAMKVGDINLAYQKWLQFSQKRLLGDHVPYVVEAYPENNMKHLSAESALYCRIVTEGLLGLEPTGLNSIKLTPSLPTGWDFLDLENLAIAGQNTAIHLKRSGKRLELVVKVNGKTVFEDKVSDKEMVEVVLAKI